MFWPSPLDVLHFLSLGNDRRGLRGRSHRNGRRESSEKAQGLFHQMGTETGYN